MSQPLLQLADFQRRLISRTFGEDALAEIDGMQLRHARHLVGRQRLNRRPCPPAAPTNAAPTGQEATMYETDGHQADTELTESYLRQFDAAWDDPEAEQEGADDE